MGEAAGLGERLRILYHHRIRSKDGQYVHVEELTRALRSLGHELILVGPPSIETASFGADSGVVRTLKESLPKAAYELMELTYAVFAYRRLVAAIKRHRPDCIYERYNLYSPSGVWAKRRFGLPLLLEVNAPLFEERKEFNGIALERLARWSQNHTWRGADYVLPVTRVLGEFVERAGVPSDRIVVIPNGINKKRFSRIVSSTEAKHKLGLDDTLVLGFVGFVREWHRLEQVVDLIADRRDASAQLLVVGDGPARSSIERRARERGVSGQLRFTGVVDRDDMALRIAAFDVALQPAVVPYASPLKLFEYLALGCAVVAPASDNIKEVLRHEDNALLFRPGDIDDFCGQVKRVCEDADLRARLGQRATETIDEGGYTWSNNARRVEGLLESLRPTGSAAGPGER